jgi:hypothetical protein
MIYHTETAWLIFFPTDHRCNSMRSSFNQRETGYLTNAGELINENMVTLMGTI